jgi:hypothetical protein
MPPEQSNQPCPLIAENGTAQLAAAPQAECTLSHVLCARNTCKFQIYSSNVQHIAQYDLPHNATLVRQQLCTLIAEI